MLSLIPRFLGNAATFTHVSGSISASDNNNGAYQTLFEPRAQVLTEPTQVARSQVAEPTQVEGEILQSNDGQDEMERFVAMEKFSNNTVVNKMLSAYDTNCMVKNKGTKRI